MASDPQDGKVEKSFVSAWFRVGAILSNYHHMVWGSNYWKWGSGNAIRTFVTRRSPESSIVVVV